VTTVTTGAHPSELARILTPVFGPLPRLGRYELIARLAVGGMAEVYLARHGELSGFKTLVVVKKILPHLAENPEFISMFLDEARIASLLDHPNVVRIVEVGRADNDYFLAMELVQGKPLASLIRRATERQEAFEPRLAALIMAQAAAGLHHAHGVSDAEGHPLGLVHRDVSPKNILVSFEGGVKVIDFGIARAMGRISQTNTGGMKGTAGYMSPEQAKSESIDRRTDVFACGVVLWEALTCRRLFRKDNDLATMRALIYDPVPRPSTVAKVPAMLEQITMKALNRDPEMRYQSALEMALALERYIGQAGGASTSHLGALMREYFAADQTDWRNLVRTAHEIEEVSSPIVSPIKMTATGLKPLAGSPPSTGTSARTVGVPVAAPTQKVGLPAIIGLFLLTVIALLLAVLLFGKPNLPAPHHDAPPPHPTGPVHTLEPLPAPPPVVEPAVESPQPEPAAETKKSKRPHRRSTTPPSSSPVNKWLPPDHRPNPFD
jgi:serine/threonine protein kinase